MLITNKHLTFFAIFYLYILSLYCSVAQRYVLYILNRPLPDWMHCYFTENGSHDDHLWFQHTTPWLQFPPQQLPHHLFKMLMNTNRRGAGVGTKGEIMFRLFRVSMSIFPGLTDRPINLIYRSSPHPLTSSTGLLSNNELLRLGTIGVLVPIVFVL